METPVPIVAGWLVRVTRTPLLGKLLVLDAALNVIAFLVLHVTPPELQQEVTVVSLATVLVLNVVLVGWALEPLHVLEETTRRVSEGNFGTRAVLPWSADGNLVRIGDTLNGLLDRVTEDRARLRSMATRVVMASDQERARIARELHDGTAQSLAALDMLLVSTQAEADPVVVRERMVLIQQIVVEALEEVRTLSHDVHPRVLDDLGLEVALSSLVRRTRLISAAAIELEISGVDGLGGDVASAAYRVVQEALRNATKHASPGCVSIQVSSDGTTVSVRVRDDGVGFDPAGASSGIGLFVMDERVALVDGTLDVSSTAGIGTEILATLPVPP